MTYSGPFEQLSLTQCANVAEETGNGLALHLITRIDELESQLNEALTENVGQYMQGFKDANADKLRDIVKTSIGNLRSLVAAKTLTEHVAEAWIEALEDALK